MPSQILDGKTIAAQRRQALQKQIAERDAQGLSKPGLAVILVGDNPASAIYVKHKRKACRDVGIESFLHQLPEQTSLEELKDLISQCNQDRSVHGILLQLPLPAHLDSEQLIECINPAKDVDGFHPFNIGRLALRQPAMRSCTPKGVMTLLQHTKQELAGKTAVIVGASNIVGRPMALELLLAKCTTTICHRFTHDLQSHIRQADILVAAIGKPGIIDSSWIKPGATVIDIGFTRTEQGAILGDIDQKSATQAAWITPVPGGVGPMTVVSLLENTLLAAQQQESKK